MRVMYYDGFENKEKQEQIKTINWTKRSELLIREDHRVLFFRNIAHHQVVPLEDDFLRNPQSYLRITL